MFPFFFSGEDLSLKLVLKLQFAFIVAAGTVAYRTISFSKWSTG